MDVFVLAVKEAGVDAVGDYAVSLPDVRDVFVGASGAEVCLAVHAHVSVGFVGVAFSDGEHFAEVEGVASLA